MKIKYLYEIPRFTYALGISYFYSSPIPVSSIRLNMLALGINQ